MLLLKLFAGVAKLVDAPDLGSGAARRVGSSPITRTKLKKIYQLITYFKFPDIVFDIFLVNSQSDLDEMNQEEGFLKF